MKLFIMQFSSSPFNYTTVGDTLERRPSQNSQMHSSVSQYCLSVLRQNSVMSAAWVKNYLME
jgi:hypothetical protein